MKKLLLLLLLPAAWACKKDELSANIKYEVICDSCQIEYTIPNEGSKINGNNVGEWTYEFEIGWGASAILTVMNKKVNGSLSAKIYRDGKVIASDELQNVDAGYLIELNEPILYK